MTTGQQGEQEFDRRVEFETFLFDLSARFTGLPEESVDANMERGLAHVAQFLQMDRVTLLEFSADREEMGVLYSWSSNASVNAAPRITRQTQPWWMEQLMRGDVSLTSRVDDLPDYASREKEYFRQRGIVSAASIPITVGGDIAGAVSFVATHRHVSWTPELVKRLRVIGEILWNAIKRFQAMRSLRDSEERFRIMADTAPIMFWMSGVDKQCTECNQMWLDFTGRSIDEERGSGWVDGVHPDDVARCLETYSRAFDQRQPFLMDYRLRRYDGEYRWIRDAGRPRFDAAGLFSGYVGSAIDVTDQKLAETALADLGARLMDAQEQERSWIARELHDDVGQRAVALTMELQSLAGLIDDGTPERHSVQEIGDRANELVRCVQALSHKLHPFALDQLGLPVAAKAFCREFSTQHKVEIACDVENVPNLPRDAALAVFRVLQEAATNAAKHSGVRRFAVRLVGTPAEIQLEVADNGTGFDPSLARTRGLGLISMEERLRLVNGTVTINSRSGEGTTITARVPKPPATQPSASM
jgi:PAS domain S-box-containing protein